MNRNTCTRWSLVAAALALTAACATAPQVDPQVQAAQAAYTSARANADVQKYASEELDHAQQLLGAAQSALESHDKQDKVDHLAYLANQSAQTAVALGEAKAAEQKVKDAAAERERIRLAARTREAEAAKRAAQTATVQAQTAQAQVANLAQQNRELAAMNAKQSTRGLVITLGDMLFDTGEAVVKSGATRELDNVANYLRENPDRQVLVEGYTDSVGNDDYNQQLSERRAQAVREALVSRGIDGSRIVTRGYGERFPVASNEDAGGRQLNRRVEVIVSNNSSPVQPRV